MDTIDKIKRQRSIPLKLRVCFPNGDVLCYSNAKETFVETLKRIDKNMIKQVTFEMCHIPLISQNIPLQYKAYMCSINDGWYVNTQSDTSTKYRQLLIINDQLKLGLTIDMSSDLKGERVKRGGKRMTILQVTFPDGTVIGELNTLDTYLQCIWKLEIDKIRQKNIEYGGKPLVTFTKQYSTQVQIDINRWITVPNSTKDKAKILKVIGIVLQQKLEIIYI